MNQNQNWAFCLGHLFDRIRAYRHPFVVARVSVISSIALIILYVSVPQARDAFRAFLQDTLGETPRHPFSKILGLTSTCIAGSLAIWYWARQSLRVLLLSGNNSLDGLIGHLPRCAATLPILGVSFGLLSASSPDVSAARRTAAAASFATLAVTIYLLLWARRRVRLLKFTDTPRAYTLIGYIGFFMGIMVFVSSLFGRQYAFFVGPIGVLWLSAAFWTTLLSLISIHGTLFQIPWFWICGCLAIFGGATNLSDNHQIRRDRSIEDKDREPSSIAATSVVDGFRDWKKTHDDGRIIFVAAGGGGIYAAYHAAYFLSRLHEETHGRSDHQIFLISSVSGGSVGAGIYVSLVAAQGGASVTTKTGNQIDYVDATRRMLDDDLLSALLAAGLGPDLLQKFIPMPIGPFDRSRALEDTLEYRWAGLQKSWGEKLVRRIDWGLPNSFWDIWIEGDGAESHIRTDIPALMVHTTNVETGTRATLGPYGLPSWIGGVNPGVYHIWSSVYGLKIPVAAALVMSARFPVITPPAGLEVGRLGAVDLPWRASSSNTDSDPVGSKLKMVRRFVDGGYFENSGLDTIYDVLRTLETTTEPNGEALLPMSRVFVISLHCISRTTLQNNEGFSDSLSPLRTVLRTRSDRAEVASARVAANCGAHYLKSIVSLEDLDHRSPYKKDAAKPDIPLGWMLSAESKRQIREQVDENLKDILIGLGERNPDAASVKRRRTE